MADVVTDQSALDNLLQDTPDVISVVLGSVAGELHSVTGSFVDGNTIAAVAASLVSELAAIGALIGFGGLDAASLKAPTSARVFARLRAEVIAIELPPRAPVGDLEAKLRLLGWDAEEELGEPPALPPVEPAPLTPSTPARTRAASTTRPLPPLAPPPEEPVRPPPMPPPAPEAAPRPPPSRPTPPPPPQPRAAVPPAMKSVASGPVFTGDLQEFCLPDLLEFLRNSHRTGLLVCTTGVGIGTIQLSRGMITGADSPNAIDLREYFLTSPEVDPERRGVLATLPPELFDDAAVEAALVSRELATPDEIERARVARIYSAFREMMGWTAGRFSFDPAIAIATNPALALSARSILMHIYQEQDEQDW
jgi:hypothetical protein